MSEEKRCPACGKPTAGYVPCPHCGADPRIRISIRAVAVLCVVALLAGSGYFLLHRSTMEARPISIASIDSWLNYASVWIEGTVISGPEVGDRSITFEVQDESGGAMEVDIFMDPGSLKAQGKIPMVGDRVKLFGMLRVYLDGSMEIRVSSFGKDQFTGEDKFQVTPAQPIETSIEELINDWSGAQSLKYTRVRLEGRITNLWPLSSAKKYLLEDNNGISVYIYVHDGLMYSENRELDVKLLQTIRVTAGVSQYGGAVQLALASYDDIENIDEITRENLIENMRETARTFEDNIKKTDNNFLENVEDMRSAFENVENTFNTFLDDLRSTIKTFGDNIENLVGALSTENVGSTFLKLLARAKNIDTFSENLENKVELFLENVENNVSGTALDNLRNVKSSFSHNMKNTVQLFRGEFVRVEGQVVFVEMEGKSKSLEVNKRYIWLDDKDNPRIWMWESIYKLLPDNKRELLRRGSVATELWGRVSSSGELEIELVGPPELELENDTYEPPLVENVAEIGSENVNDFVMVEGEVISPIENVAAGAGLPSHRKFTLQDNFVENIKIWISNTVYERMLDPPTTWDNLRVVGKVAVSGNEVQVRPGMPSDVKVS